MVTGQASMGLRTIVSPDDHVIEPVVNSLSAASVRYSVIV